jgi:hypothetical protein
MNAMTTEQRDYMIRRMDEITHEKIKAKETELFGENGSHYQPTWGMVFEAIKAGEIVLKEGTESLTRPYLMPTDVEWPALDAKREQLQAYRETLRVERQRIMDDLMLGDSVSALTKYAAI